MNMPPASSQIDGWIVNRQHTVHVTQLTSSSVFTGFLPSPVLAMTMPLMMNAVDSTPNSRPHICTETSDRP